MKKKTSLQEKLANSKDLPRVEKIDEKKSKRWGTETYVIPAPVEVDAHKSQMAIDSKPNKGSNFTLKLTTYFKGK